MDPYITIALVEYIQLLHKGNLDKFLFSSFEMELKSCSALEVNIAIENLIIRYRDVELLESTVAKFIRAAMVGLESQQEPEYPSDTIFCILAKENRIIKSVLRNLKKAYLGILPGLKENLNESKGQLKTELETIKTIKKHYLKLQYGVFSALETEGAPVQCIQLMWHLEKTIWSKYKACFELLSGNDWNFNQFNKTYGQMFFLLTSLLFREEKIFFPVAYKYLSNDIQRRLLLDVNHYGIIES